MAIHAPITGVPLRAPLTPTFRLANRAEIEQEIDRLIELLDAADGDCDLEDDDPAGDPIDQKGECWTDDGRGVHKTRPIYPLDQTRTPTNHRRVEQERYAANAGLVRSPTGGWGYPS